MPPSPSLPSVDTSLPPRPGRGRAAARAGNGRGAAAPHRPRASRPPRDGSEPAVPTAPFRSAEEAFFWFVRCQIVRRDGARFEAGNGLRRPCDPDDVYLVIITLRRRRVLDAAHLETLGRFGILGRPPDRRCREEEAAARRWDEALDRLTTPLRAKGILA